MRSTARVGRLAVAGAALLVPFAVLLAAGQPIFTDDLWWHLALGDAYASEGPRLAEDPLLFTADGPPAPASWLADRLLAALAATAGFDALRILHVVAVAVFLVLGWRIALRVGAGPMLAPGVAAVLAAISAYRLVQLRPQLATMIGAAWLFQALIARRDPPSIARMVGAVLGIALWANLHGGFLLGPAMLLGSAAACVLAALAAGDADRARLLGRAGRLAATGTAAGVATGLQPGGFSLPGALLAAGAATPRLWLVVDEWAPLDPFALPVPGLPPTPLGFALFWGLLLGTLWAVLRVARVARTDPVLVPLAALSLGALCATVFAVRFVWLSFLPLALLVWALRDVFAARVLPRWLPAAGIAGHVALFVAFVGVGAWGPIARGLGPAGSWARYAESYTPARHFGHAVWFLGDAELEGRLGNEYTSGGFLGYWLAPSLRTLVNGTLNFPPEVLEAVGALREGRALRPDETPSALLDRLGVEVFLGVGEPVLPAVRRPRPYTTALLEGEAGWIPVFRSQRSAVYLRRGEAQRENLARVAAYYQSRGVPFSEQDGFRADAAIGAALPWAVENGVVPVDFARLRVRAQARERAAMDRLARVHCLLGHYERALRLDRALLAQHPDHGPARRRVAWSLLRLGDASGARRVAAAMAPGPLATLYASLAVALEQDPRDPLARAAIRRLPLLSPPEAADVRAETLRPELRPARRSAG